MTDEDEIRAVARAHDKTLVTNDADAVAAHMTEDWVYVGPDGTTTKQELIGWIRSGRLAHHTMSVVGGERLARPTDDTVVLTERKASSGTWDGSSYQADEWITQVFVRQNGTWRCVFCQKSPCTSSAPTTATERTGS
jgi:ketosteroid isomerase-like protein